MDWEQRYAAATDRLFSDTPSDLLIAERNRFIPGQRALALGDGEGRNGVWLAEQGLQVTALDLSSTALQRGASLAAQRGVELEQLSTDFFAWTWPKAHFDLVTFIFVHLPGPLRQRLYGHILDCVRPGGLILIEAYHPNLPRPPGVGPSDPAMLADEMELETAFSTTEILRLEQTMTQITLDGEQRGEGGVTHFTARRLA